MDKITGWYARLIHKEHALAANAKTWRTCEMHPCYLLRRAETHGIPKADYAESDGAGSY